MKRAIIIFTRIPLPGHTKTRMMPVLKPDECAKLHICFLKDIKTACDETFIDFFICYAPEGDNQLKILKKIFGNQKEYFPQTGDSLGERMYHAFCEVRNRGYHSCILIGTDVPELSGKDIRRAFDALKRCDVVFGRTLDGGYYLVGMKHPRKEVFGLDAYGHASVFEDTLKELERRKLKIGYTRTLSDMDTPADLNGYRERMRMDRRLRNTVTGRYVNQLSRISIIIPVYNEKKTIDFMKEQLKPLVNECEIIFVDGGSKDGTLDTISDEFTAIHAPKSRAKQMNAGAMASHGDILFFLHCDSELPTNPLEEIRRVMKRYPVGCFGIAFRSRNFFMFTCRVISNHRIKDRKVMFGDQGIFIERKLFFDIGMFPEIPIMEDYQFSLNLKRKNIPIGMTKKRIITSDRRFPKGTIAKLRLMWKMNRLRKMYRDNVMIEKIADMYQDIR